MNEWILYTILHNIIHNTTYWDYHNLPKQTESSVCLQYHPYDSPANQHYEYSTKETSRALDLMRLEEKSKSSLESYYEEDASYKEDLKGGEGGREREGGGGKRELVHKSMNHTSIGMNHGTGSYISHC